MKSYRCYLCKPVAVEIETGPIAPARGCACAFVLGGLCWVVIFALAALVWVNVIVPRLG